MDGDGHADVMAGATNHDGAGAGAGRAAVYSGKDGSVLKEWLGGEAGDGFGSTVAGSTGAGSAGDGHELLVVGASNAGEGNRGRVYVYKGLEDQPAYVIESDDPRLRFPVGPDAHPFLGWRSSLSDEDWVGLGGFEHDADYYQRVFLDTGVDLRST